MTLRAAESCDLISTTQLQNGSGRWIPSVPGQISVSGGRNGNSFLCIVTQNNGPGSFYKNFDNQSTWIVGFAFYCSSLVAENRIAAVVDAGVEQVGLYLRTDQKFEFRRTGTVLVTQALATITLNAWNYIEMKVVVANSGGTAELRINQVVEATYTGDTQQSANAYGNRIHIGPTVGVGGGGGSSYFTVNFDDIYINDGNGSINNGYIGDVLVKALLPTAEGNSSNFTPSSGSDNALMVDDAPANDDTDYVSSGTVGHKDTYVYQNLAANANTIKAVVLVSRMRKDDAGGRTMKHIVRPGSTDNESAAFAISQSYLYYESIHESNPDTASPWTPAEVNASEFGIKIES